MKHEIPLVSIEIPAFKGAWLADAVASVLRQSSPDWELSVVWDGGDAHARTIVEGLASLRDERIRGYVGERRGIAGARRFLTEHSRAPWILPLDDDDMLTPDAVATFAEAVRAMPWAGIVRARRSFIDADGAPLAQDDWFPFAPRTFQHGMPCDVYNHAQPMLIRRDAYDRTAGWTGFPDFKNAGEDCDIFVRIEEIAPIELLDRVLYHYRLSRQRTSHELGTASAFEMWRRIADAAITRLGVAAQRIGETPPYAYARLAPAPLAMPLDIVVIGEPDSGAVSGEAIGFIEPGAHLAPGALPTITHAFNETRADCVVHTDSDGRPSALLVARHAVLRAVGGFGTTFAAGSLAVLDCYLTAMRRNFSCVALPGLVRIGTPQEPPHHDEFARFTAKWRLGTTT